MPENVDGSSKCLGSGKLTIRLRGLVIAIAAGAIIIAAAMLQPNPLGHGTHEQLDLPSCSFMVRHSMPCPFCGLTTSFAAFIRLQASKAFAAHPFGPILFVVIIAAGIAGIIEFARGRSLIFRFPVALWWALAVFLGILVGWIIKLRLLT